MAAISALLARAVDEFGAERVYVELAGGALALSAWGWVISFVWVVL